MPVFHHSQLHEHLERAKTTAFDPVYLIHGEELLYKRALTSLLEAMLPQKVRDHHYEPVDGSNGREGEALEKANTFSLLGDTKVVALLDSTVFYSRVDTAEILHKVKEAHQRGEAKKAASQLLGLMSRKELAFEDLAPDNRSKTLGADAPDSDDESWIDEVIGYCRDNGFSVPPRSDGAKLLQQAVENGFPKGNHLVITTDRVDRRQGLYKAVEAHGRVIDCSVPAGDRKADKQVQEAALQEQARSLTSRAGKRLDPMAFRALVEMTGFNLRAFSNQLEKLISYVGPRKTLTADDVSAALERTRTDPLYEFTNAVTDRNPEAALFYLNSLLTTGAVDHPLQLLTAMVNQVRRLVILRDFLESSPGRLWQPGCSYATFQSRVMPAILEFDRRLINSIDQWQADLAKRPDEGPAAAPKKKPKKKQASLGADLLIAGRGKSPYPIYLMLKKAEGFSRNRLAAILAHLLEIDQRLKSTAGNPKTVLETAVLFICRET